MLKVIAHTIFRIRVSALLVAFLSLVSVAAADGTFNWVDAIGGDESSFPAAIAVDSNDNVYVAGAFTGTVDLDPGAGTQEVTAAVFDSYVIKLNSAGVFVWGFTLTAGIEDLTVDGSGNVYCVGTFADTQDFDPGGGTAELTSLGGGFNDTDAFVLKTNSNGVFDFVFAIGGTDVEVVSDIAVDGSGQIYVTGYLDGTTDFDPSGSTANLTATGSEDLFVAKYSAVGAYLWAGASDGGTTGDTVSPNDIALDGLGAVVVAGTFNGRIDFDPSGGLAFINNGSYPSSDTQAFLLKLDSAGTFEWVRGLGGNGSDEGYSVAVDSGDNIHFSGNFSGTVDLDPSAGTQEVTSNSASSDIFHTVLETDADYLWHATIGSSSSDVPNHMTLDEDDNIFTTGIFKNSMDFDPGPGTATVVPSDDGSVFPYFDAFVWKLGPTGSYKFARSLGNQLWNEGQFIEVDSAGASYTAGIFQGTIDFDPGAGTQNLAAVALFDHYILKLEGPSESVWVDFAFSGTETGSESQPFDTLVEAIAAVSAGGTISIKGNTGDSSTAETLTINQAVTLEAVSGTIQLGL